MWSKQRRVSRAGVLRRARPALRARRRREDVANAAAARQHALACSANARPRGRACGAGTPVAVANVDFHGSVPATTVTAPGTLVMIMGTSNGHLAARRTSSSTSRACAASSRTASCPGSSATRRASRRSATSSPGSREHVVPARYRDEARRRGVSVHDVLAEEAAALRPGESGLLALDWWNGNRSVLVDADLRGPARRDDARDASRRRSTGPDRGDGVRHARDRRGIRAMPGCRSTRSSPAAGCPTAIHF